MKRIGLALLAVVVGVAATFHTRPVAAQSQRGYDWCYEFTFDFNDEGFVYGGDDAWSSVAGDIYSVDENLNVSYTAPGLVNAKLIEITIDAQRYIPIPLTPTFPAPTPGPTTLEGNFNAFGAVRSLEFDLATGNLGTILIYPNGSSGTTFSLDLTHTQNVDANLTNIRVFGDGPSPWGTTRCYELPYLEWCYQIPFDEVAMPNGSVGINGEVASDENGFISFSFSSPLTVAPRTITVEGYKLSGGRAGGPPSGGNIAIGGNVFGVTISDNIALWSDNYSETYESAGILSGTTANVTIQSDRDIALSVFRLTGTGANPFGVSNCRDFGIILQPPPTAVPTAIPTSRPTDTPEPTETATPTPTPTSTGATPTPTPTPTARVFLGPVSTVQGNVNCPYECYLMAGAPADERAYPIGVMLLEMGGDISGSAEYGSSFSMKNGSINDLDFLTATPGYGLFNQWSPPGVTPPAAGMVQGGPLATAVVTPGQYYTGAQGVRSNASATWYKWGFLFWGDNTGGFDSSSVFARFRPVMYGWPTPSPTPTNTPQATRTPTATRTIGPTFTPNGSATATRTPTRTPFVVVPPPTLNPNVTPLPTIYNYLTATGTAQVIGTPNPTWTPVVYATGTPVNTVTPGPSPTGGALTPTAASPGNSTPAATIPPAGEYGDVAELGGNILGVGNDLFNMGRNWLSEFSARVNGIVTAWNTAPVTAPPGVPLCTTQPQLNQFCAILYFIRYTILSGTIGGLIMPLATIVFDLFIVFLFIRMLRAILARLSKVTEV